MKKVYAELKTDSLAHRYNGYYLEEDERRKVISRERALDW